MFIKALRRVYRKRGIAGLNPAFLIYIRGLLKLLQPCVSILDLGCGSGSPAQYADGHKIGLDGYALI